MWTSRVAVAAKKEAEAFKQLTTLRGLELSVSLLLTENEVCSDDDEAGNESDEAGGRVTSEGSDDSESDDEEAGWSDARLTGSWEKICCCSGVRGGGK